MITSRFLSLSRRWRVCAIGCALVLALAVAIASSAGCGGSKSTSRSGSSGASDVGRDEADRSLSFREVLTRGNDLSSCRDALRVLNSSTSDDGAQRIPSLDSGRRAEYQELLGLTNDELKEIQGDRYTLLDGRHLDGCFLFRDAARALKLTDHKKLDRARIGFDWSMRQVVLSPGRLGSVVAPPEFVLRTGDGSVLERALVFLALMDQAGCESCLVVFPSKKNDGPRHLACGVLADKGQESQLYLFDPYLGMPLPGLEGEDIATLQSIRKQDHLLEPLGVTKDDLFAVVPTDIVLVSPLSTLAPRNRYLQETLEAAGMTVRLADTDVKSRKERFEAVVRQPAGAPEPAVRFRADYLPDPVTLLSRFVPPTEGGSEDPARQPFPLRRLPGFAPERLNDVNVQLGPMQRYQLSAVDWQAFPRSLRELDYQSEVGQSPRNTYLSLMMPYFGGMPRKGRDLLLRGQLDDAIKQFASDREELPDLAAHLQVAPTRTLAETLRSIEDGKASWKDLVNSDLARQADMRTDHVDKVFLQVRKAEAEKDKAKEAEARAELQTAMAEAARLWGPLLEAVTADQRAFLAAYQLALARHEQAERLQERSARSSEGKRKAPDAWSGAESAWREFLHNHPSSPQAAHARVWYARTKAMQGNTEQAAIVLTQPSASFPLSETERLAREFAAKHLPKN